MSGTLAYSFLEPEPEPEIEHIKRAKMTSRPVKKNRGEYNAEKVNETMQKIKNIHNKPQKQPLFSQKTNSTGEFNPPANPISASSLKLNQVTENMVGGMDMKQVLDTETPEPLSSYDNYSPSMNSAEYLSDSATEQATQEYYRENLPNQGVINQHNQYKTRNQIHGQHIQEPFYTHNSGANSDQLMHKINYMISLLEEQKDAKTQHVAEEVVMYSFLGVFMIFIADSFSKVGKYVR